MTDNTPPKPSKSLDGFIHGSWASSVEDVAARFDRLAVELRRLKDVGPDGVRVKHGDPVPDYVAAAQDAMRRVVWALANSSVDHLVTVAVDVTAARRDLLASAGAPDTEGEGKP